MFNERLAPKPTSELIKYFSQLYNRLATETLTNSDFKGVFHDKPPLLGGPHLENSTEGVLGIFTYCANRLPPEFLLSRKNHIFLYSEPGFFIDISPSRKKPENRSRWHIIDTDDKSEKNFILQIRGETDVSGEIFPMLAGLEFVRQYAQDHIKDPNIRKIIFNKYVELLRRNNIVDVDFKRIFARNFLRNKFSIHPLYEDHLPYWYLEKHGSERTAVFLTELIQKKMLEKEIALADINGILYMNDFTLRSLLSTASLNSNIESRSENYRNYITRLANSAYDQEKNKFSAAGTKGGQKKSVRISNLAKLGQQISNYQTYYKEAEFTNLKNLFIDFAIMQFLSSYKDKDEIVLGLINKINDPDYIQNNLGIMTLIETAQSPTADPVRLVDFNRVSDDILTNLNPILKEIIIKFKGKKIMLMMIPYALGDLSYSIASSLKNLRDTNLLNYIIEIGKVGLAMGENMPSLGLPDSDIRPGLRVVPVMTEISHLSEDPVPLNNLVIREDARGLNRKPKEAFIEVHQKQVHGVLLQTQGDFQEVESGLPRVLDMESMHLAKLQELGLRIIKVDYISDINYVDETAVKLKNSLATSLGDRGRYGVYTSLIVALRALIRQFN